MLRLCSVKCNEYIRESKATLGRFIKISAREKERTEDLLKIKAILAAIGNYSTFVLY